MDASRALAAAAGVPGRLVRTNYAVYRGYRLARMRWSLRGLARQRPVLVYQMGKVGSTAVAATLTASLGGRPAVHVHALSRDQLAAEDAVCRRRFERGAAIDAVHLRGCVVSGFIEAIGRHGDIDVVTMVREPVARNLSAFFQTLVSDFPDLDARLRAEPESIALVDELRTTFLTDGWNGDPMDWFDRELRSVLGVDVLATPFDTDEGHATYRAPGVRVLLVRAEDLAAVFPAAAAAFFGVDVQLARRNDPDSKFYAAAYRHILDRPGFPAAYLDRMHGSPHVQHLYSADELLRFRTRWSIPA